MPVTLDPTVGGASANAYLSVADADAYFNTRMYASAWTSIVDPDIKARAIISATRRLDLLSYKGHPSFENQALRWPRQYIPREDSFSPQDREIVYYGATWWPRDAIPEKVKQACAELALWYVTKGSDPHTPDALRAFNSVTLPGLDINLRGSDMPAPDELPRVVTDLLAEFRLPRGVRVMRS